MASAGVAIALPPPPPPAVDFGGSSMAIAVALSMVGSLCYVCSLMSIAYPSFLVREKRGGKQFHACWQCCFFLMYALGQLGSAGFSMIGSWFGPVSITLPVYMGSMLLWNLIVMSSLRMQTFSKGQQVGTIVLVVATIMLIDAGPTAEGSVAKTGEELVSSLPAVAWMLAFGVLWMCACAGMVADAATELCDRKPMSTSRLMAIYVTTQATATSAVTTLGKLLVMVQGGVFLGVGGLLAITAATNVYSNMLAARKMNQAHFIPLSSCGALILNQLTGLILWEDWRTIRSWVTYVGIHVLILLGMYDITTADVFEHMGESHAAVGKKLGALSPRELGRSITLPTLSFPRNFPSAARDTGGNPCSGNICGSVCGSTPAANGYAPMET